MSRKKWLAVISTLILLVSISSVAWSQSEPIPLCTTGYPVAPALDPPSLDREAAGPSQDNLMAWANVLTDPSLRGRYPGTEGSARVARLLAQQMAQFGVAGPLIGSEYCQLFPVPYSGPDQNVVGMWTSEPGSARPVVIVMAHYDSLGTDLHEQPFPGANDNASGVAVLMEVARLLPIVGRDWPFDVLLVATGSQMGGLLGSSALLVDPPVPLGRVHLLIELDIVGRQMLDGMWTRTLLGNPVDAMGYSHSEEDGAWVLRLVRDAAEAQSIPVFGIPESVLEGTGFMSDATVFQDHVPTVTLSTGGSIDFHLITDTVENLDPGQLEGATRLVMGMLELIADPSGEPESAPTEP